MGTDSPRLQAQESTVGTVSPHPQAQESTVGTAWASILGAVSSGPGAQMARS